MTNPLHRRAPAAGVLAALALACGAPELKRAGPFPRDDAHAFEIAHTTLPQDATGIRYEGSQGIDWVLELEFRLPSPERARAWVGQDLCTPNPVATDFAHTSVSTSPDWFGEPLPDGWGCTFGERPGFWGTARIDTLDSGEARIQLSLVD